MDMRKTKCALCCTQDDYTILYAENLPTAGISSVEYDSRRMRDYMHFQIVKCKTCNLVRSDPIIDPELIDNLYEQSDCSYTTEKENEPLARTYGRYLENIVNSYDVNRSSYLDIGCSNGFMIEKAIEMGFSNARGIEPSLAAIEHASDKIKARIIPGMFDSSKFENETFDLISFFQTFDHIIEPNEFLQDVRKKLNEKGFVIAINHNIGSISYKFLREKSPIIDIGHTYLYDLTTMRKIFEKNQFKVHKVFPVKNWVTLSRLLELMPINEKSKNVLAKIQNGLGIQNMQLPLYLGNLGIYAQKN
jgi:SAM-dependent methyltransferase